MEVKRMASLGSGSDWGRLQGHGRRGVTGDNDREGTNQEVLRGGADGGGGWERREDREGPGQRNLGQEAGRELA